ncbi:MAG TPA: HAD family hydrolase [Opitutaceae bacterium]|nr:HAD family hydrolase [Opitutaceae bacterium]
MSDRLVLWDIDGTLVTTGRSGERALLALARELYQRDLGERLPVELAGRTDRLILRDLLAYLERPVTEEEVARARAAYLAGLPSALALGPAQVLPGVGRALAEIHRHPSIHQALLTGNLKEGARLKLTHMELWHYFEFGAFADDSAERNELGPFALARAKENLGLDFPPERVWIIGDTPHDIACGRAIGAHTIAVATGTYDLAALERHRPTHAVADLSDTEGLLRWIQA